MTPKLTEQEQAKWTEDGWTPQAAAISDPQTLAASLGIKIGRALTLIAEYKAQAHNGEVAGGDVVERALAGDVKAQREVNRTANGYSWVALRNGKPDLSESRKLVKELSERPARRSRFHGLLVIDISELSKAAEKLPREPLSQHILDDYDNKMIDGDTGADWAPLWPERGNSRVLWLIHGRHLLPGWAMTDPVRVIRELSEKTVPTHWERLEVAWNRASAVERAQAEEALFSEPEAVHAEPTLGKQPPHTVANQGGGPLIFFLGHTRDRKHVEDLLTHCCALPARLAASLQVPPGTNSLRWIADHMNVAELVVVVLSADALADGDFTDLANMAINAGKRVIPYIARPCLYPPQFARLTPAGGVPGNAYRAAADLRGLLGSETVNPKARKLRDRLENMQDSELDAFCLDNYRDVLRQFSNGMTKTAKVSLLLSYKDRGDVERVLNTTRW